MYIETPEIDRALLSTQWAGPTQIKELRCGVNFFQYLNSKIFLFASSLCLPQDCFFFFFFCFVILSSIIAFLPYFFRQSMRIPNGMFTLWHAYLKLSVFLYFFFPHLAHVMFFTFSCNLLSRPLYKNNNADSNSVSYF